MKQHGDSELLKDGSHDSHLKIIQAPSPPKLYVRLNRNLGKIETQKTF